MSTLIPLPLETPEIDAELAGGARFRRSLLPGGVRLLSERVPGASSASIGFWVPLGSRDESEGQFGATHFLEHLLFKGTREHSAYELALAFDRVGGEHNAATAHEHTVYHAKVRDADLGMAIGVLCEMITSSVIDPGEFETERGVILEELAMADDDPGDVLWESFASTAYGDHPLGRPIGGTPESIRAMSRDAVWDYYRERYLPGNLVVTIAGAVDHDRAARLVEQGLARGGWQLDPAAAPQPRRETRLASVTPASRLTVIERPLEQCNLMLGASGLRVRDERRHALALMHRVFGGGMSSRLFQEVRERRGLAYSVHSWSTSGSDHGLTGMYVGCAPAKAAEAVRVLRDETRRLLEDGVSEQELADAKGASAGSSALALEDTDARMSRLGRAEIHLGEFADLDAALERVEAVSREDILALARELLAGPLTAAAVGSLPAEARAELER